MKTFDIDTISLKIQSQNTEAIEGLRGEVISHIEKLGKLFADINSCEVMLHEIKNNQKKNSSVEVKINVPGQVLYASDHGENFHVALRLTFDELHDQLYKYKEKLKEKMVTERETSERS